VKSSKKFVPTDPLNASAGRVAPLLSICLIVKNEAACLGRCLSSAQEIADEIIVVDTGSTDDTVSLARSFGATVVCSVWNNDFSHARNVSLRSAAGAWLLWLDADDVIPKKSIEIIQNLKLKKPDRVLGFIVRNEKKGQTGSEFIQARMFPNRPDIFFERRIHEQMMLSALRAGLRMEQTAAVIEHHGYADPHTMRLKARRNIEMLLGEYDRAAPDAITAVEIADAYSIVNDAGNARTWYETALSVPGCVEQSAHLASQAHWGLGNLLNNNADFDAAIAHLQKALVLSPGRPDVGYSLAVALDLSGRKDDAIERLYGVFRQSAPPLLIGVDFREAKLKAVLRLDRLLRETGRNEEADGLADEALTAMPHRPEIQNLAGRAYVRGGRLMDGLHAFEKSLELDRPNNIDAYVGLCQIYLRANKRENAVQTVKSVQPLYGHMPRYWALYRQCMGESAAAEIPESIDKAEISAETERINLQFQL
jgi:tetratricopeptide (TPR) repeat protein